jgi:hypothetical protein
VFLITGGSNSSALTSTELYGDRIFSDDFELH